MRAGIASIGILSFGIADDRRQAGGAGAEQFREFGCCDVKGDLLIDQSVEPVVGQQAERRLDPPPVVPARAATR